MNFPEEFRDLLLDETRAFAVLATISKRGSPQATPLWFSMDGEDILINSAEGRVKDRNMRRNPQVALAILDPRSPYRYLQVRGRVTEITMVGADEHIHALSVKYTGHRYSIPAQQTRVTYRITPFAYSGMD